MKEEIKKSFGFTLVELMVSVTIMVVLLAIGTFSISQFIETKKVLGVKDELLTQIKLARNLSITNQLPDQTFDLKFVKVTILNKNINVDGIKSDGITTLSFFTKNISTDTDLTINLKNNGTNVTSFGFSGRSGRLTDGNGNLTNGPILITITDGANTNSFNINDLGIVNNEI